MTSKLRLGVSCFVLLGVIATAEPSTASAQQPKLDIKLFAGASGTTYVSLLETGRERETFAGWQIGFGPRIRKRRWFVEALFSFNRWSLPRVSFELPCEGLPGCPPSGVVTERFRGRVSSFELPINAGFIPYANVFFKIFIYAGYVNHFNTRIKALVTIEETGDESEVRLRPKEVDLAIYQAIARFGVNIDLAMFNLDFNYSISMNSATTTSYRTGYHQVQLNVAYLF
jgi:hypothetical protein